MDTSDAQLHHLDAPGGWEATRHHVALTQLLQSLGPFDDVQVAISYTGGEGWNRASCSLYRGEEHVQQFYVPLGTLATDPVLFMLSALGNFAQRWHAPTLFPSP